MLTISRRSILGKVYSYWERLGGRSRAQGQEKLCNFVWVILFRTWWLAYWKQPIIFKWLRPWMLHAALMVISLLVVSPAARDATLIVMRVAVGIAIGITVGIAATKFMIRPIWRWFWGKRYAYLVYPWTVTTVFLHGLAFLNFRTLFWRVLLFEFFIAVIVTIYIFWDSALEYLKAMVCADIELV